MSSSAEVSFKPEELAKIDYNPPSTNWTDPKVDFVAKKGNWCYSGVHGSLDYLDLPIPKTKFAPTDEDWGLPENWREIIF